ncbi:MAG: acetyltransferase [Candidatus Peribacter sp.]|nr:acetyltransferase [Candidatus Peribacter sp.]
MTLLPLVLFGAGGHGKVVADAAAGNWRVIGFIDDTRTGEHGGYPILGNQKALEHLKKEGAHCIVSIGDCAGRAKTQEMLEKMGFTMATVIHPSATVSKSARIAAGSAVLAQTTVGPDAVLGKGCIVNTCASVDHDCAVGDYTHIAPGAHVAGGVTIGTQTFVGIGSCVREYCSIGSRVVVGAGAAVVTDFGDDVTVLGVPAVVKGR